MEEEYRRGFDTHHIFSVDEFYWENRPRYYEALDAVRREGEDLTGWVEYAAEGLHLTLERVWTRVQKLSGQPGQKKLVLRPRQEQLLHAPCRGRNLSRDVHTLQGVHIGDFRPPVKCRFVVGIVSGFNVMFGPGSRRRFEEEFRSAKENHGIVTSLPREAPANEPRGYCRPSLSF